MSWLLLTLMAPFWVLKYHECPQTPIELASCAAQMGFTQWGCNAITLTADWGPPTTGSPAKFYTVRIVIEGYCLEPPRTIVVPDWASQVKLQCAGNDSLGREGEFSEYSDWQRLW